MQSRPLIVTTAASAASDRAALRRGHVSALGSLALVGGALLVGYGVAENASRQQASASVPRVVEARGDLGPEERVNVDVFRRASPSVVHIANVAQVRGGWNPWTARPMAGGEATQGTGTGFVWDDAGHIVTNYHVVHQADRLVVTLEDQSQYDARVVGLAPHHDLAVVEIDAPKERLRPIALGTSNDLLVGQHVYAIGNPFGFDQTLTIGIVSGLGREIRSLTNHRIADVIQTDAAINPGNSGGPLLDSAGRMIGVNTAIYSPSGAYAGIGFAVPVDNVQRVVPELIERGTVRRPGLGFVPLAAQTRMRMGLEGVAVAQVEPDSAAARAGLLPPEHFGRDRYLLDVIVEIDGQPVRREEDLYDILDAREVGDRIELVVHRGKEERRLTARLQALN